MGVRVASHSSIILKSDAVSTTTAEAIINKFEAIINKFNE
jgi:hypothetical protein